MPQVSRHKRRYNIIAQSACNIIKNKTIHNLYGALWRHVFKMVSQVAICRPSSNLV